MQRDRVYIANDVEAAGHRLGIHSTLSWGACAVSREPLTFEEYRMRGLLFYAEIRPTSMLFEMEAMRVGCLHLMCLEGLREKDPRYDPNHAEFDPSLVLAHMYRVCDPPEVVVENFLVWIRWIVDGRRCIGLTDTVFFDSGRVNLLLGAHSTQPSPLGHGGLDLDSIYRGYTRNEKANLKELGVPDTRAQPHRADHDAVFLAQQTHELLFNRMGW